ncbi:MAG TPA: nitrilase-related carbon-nitrogen hydrolase [Spirochaetia bacterium]
MKATIACGQFAPFPGDIERNARTMAAQAREAARRGAALIVFPELCLCGYTAAADAPSRAVRRDGPGMARVTDIARESVIAVCFGFVEDDGEGRLFNSLGLVDPAGGLVDVYRKVHLWKGEEAWAVPGGRFTVAVLGGLPVGMWICYDTRFPETARSVARIGATLGLAGSAWFGPAAEWELALRSRALDNGIFCAGAALQGSFEGQPFHGDSLVIGPHGDILARAAEGETAVITAEYDGDAVDAFRARLPLLDDLRPESYA